MQFTKNDSCLREIFICGNYIQFFCKVPHIPHILYSRCLNPVGISGLIIQDKRTM